ncbi:MAG: 30S ribosomal protein S6 [Anaerolineae bacterium]|nr:30S ribosomal protein S6 [Anaerolineae bacterium]
MREYELTYIVRPDADEEAVAAVGARVEQIVAANGGRMLKTEHPWGKEKRRLAYPIRRYTEGYYVLHHAELTDKAIREIERQLRLSEDVVRHLLVRVEPKPAPEAAETA